MNRAACDTLELVVTLAHEGSMKRVQVHCDCCGGHRFTVEWDDGREEVQEVPHDVASICDACDRAPPRPVRISKDDWPLMRWRRNEAEKKAAAAVAAKTPPKERGHRARDEARSAFKVADRERRLTRAGAGYDGAASGSDGTSSQEGATVINARF